MFGFGSWLLNEIGSLVCELRALCRKSGLMFTSVPKNFLFHAGKRSYVIRM